jgi:hypothetical protein
MTRMARPWFTRTCENGKGEGFSTSNVKKAPLLR